MCDFLIIQLQAYHGMLKKQMHSLGISDNNLVIVGANDDSW